MTSSTTPMFLETYRRIYSKYAHLTRDRKDIQARQQTNLFKANIRVYNFLKDKVRQYLHGMPGEQLLNLLVATGATTSQIKSVLDWQNGIASVIPSSQLLEQALLIAPENHPARLDIIAHYIHQGQFKDASKHFTLLRQFNPDQSTIEQLALLLTTEPAKAASLGTQDETEVNKLPSPLKVAVFTLDIPEQACARLRLLDPFATLPGIVEVLWGVTIKDSNYSINLDMITAADVIVVQRFFPRKGTLSYLEQIFNSGKPVMYEIDDLLTDVPDANHLKSWIKETTDLLPEILHRFDAVTVTTEPLRAKLEPYADELHVVPTSLNADVWSKSKIENSSEHIRIGFCGTPTHTAELELIEPVLARIAHEYGDAVSFIFMGCANEVLSRLPGFRFIPFENSYAAYAQKLQEISLDIALVPLVDNPFNRCKSNIKWLEYSACGTAGIYADLPPYNLCVEHGRTGLLAGKNPEQWYQAIRLLLEHDQLRRSIADNARDKVLNEYSLRSPGMNYGQFLCRWYDRWHIGHQSSRPLVSVIIPVFNQLAYTRKCLESLFSSLQSLADRIELIVVDNGSDDGTATYLQTLGASIRVVTHGVNLGFAKDATVALMLQRGAIWYF